MTVRKAVILAAGLGTRLLPFSKEMPKEMIPIYVAENGELVLKPVVQILFEQLYDAGVREFCFVVGRGKRLIEDHFTPDWSFLDLLRSKGRDYLARRLEGFYQKVERSLIVWVNQPRPLGTGDAILRARKFVKDEPFIAAAGDNIYYNGVEIIRGLTRAFEKYGGTFLTVRRVEDPKRYGVVDFEKIDDRIFRVKGLEEKPEKPKTDYVNTSLYVFDSGIFYALKRCSPSKRGEIEITSAIRLLIEGGSPVYAFDAGNSPWIDVGTAETYLKALVFSLKSIGQDDLMRQLLDSPT